ncbi:hypothetical protein Taro_012902 [Colocasia esculenta]|uniref:C3H1-type domain-containing protein n=1 Tax=Colocasia esculenta TaxID=4460 RepID=A0A843UKJ0_COLES|nr:hypothetical protein [Colocasia esculenta]
MMLGEGHRPSPVIHVPPWPVYEDVVGGASYPVLPVSGVASGNGAAGGGGGEFSPYLLGEAALTALQRFLPSNEVYGSDDGGEDSDLSEAPVDAYSCDEFRIYEFKVRRCARGRSHDWTECPYAHPGEKARRRDPRKYHYSGTACPDFRKGCCKRGDACEYAHGVFECWLHPARYRTQPCKDGVNCRRRVCFFAHTPEQLRVLPQTAQQQQPGPPSPRGFDDGSPLRHHSLDAYFTKNLISSPTSTLISPPMSPPSDSPPLSPNGPSLRRPSLPVGSSMSEVLVSFRQLQLSKAKSVPASWGLQVAGLGSPRGLGVRPGFCSVPATPTRSSMGGCGGLFEDWGEPTERVESGRDLRAKIYEKLSKEIGMGRGDEGEDDGELVAAAPDVGWVSDLLK